ncbi:methyltransferase domain-containing protein [Gellertiella hungarica]|uniref:SAM-dependent methyltransferase n=1 Tax=Gellertiella hungarica TaxID=1572859 RepID=A0A7W6J5L5_9HYPH|nr:methyltransferase domain-containing protein [Gellertiella hungarica]MBB4065189.1 SAM-dependent methyltransferase [Gellertiella hungarica]
MDALFDTELVTIRRRRALQQPVEGADFLMKLAADELAERLSVVERSFDVAVELYGGTGATGEACLATGKIGMLRRIELPDAFARTDATVATAPLEILPLEPESANLILSPLSLHLTNDTPGVFIQARRALRPDGLFLAMIPGAGTLAELKDVLLQAETELYGGVSPRVIPFPDVRDVGALMQRAGFALPVVDAESRTVRYSSLFSLMRDLRGMGMTNPLVGRSRRPLTRAFFLRAAEIYAERYADPDGRIRATFAFINASGWAPHESQQKPLKPGSAKARLADALKGR